MLAPIVAFRGVVLSRTEASVAAVLAAPIAFGSANAYSLASGALATVLAAPRISGAATVIPRGTAPVRAILRGFAVQSAGAVAEARIVPAAPRFYGRHRRHIRADRIRYARQRQAFLNHHAIRLNMIWPDVAACLKRGVTADQIRGAASWRDIWRVT